eukprot:TRINITY_DN76057_c0_g1_i1.p1 TRINITY_DN76057_c0_g1~~TRINITY_DN76057_c0_g1_i1.p1  ORF type:complete len:370 (-),score=48.54 TRINITY_DN76057_c0_g1_i1:84-1193(-)
MFSPRPRKLRRQLLGWAAVLTCLGAFSRLHSAWVGAPTEGLRPPARSLPTTLQAAVSAAPEGSGGDADLALIVPGFLGSAEDFQGLATDMTAAGYPAVVVPIRWWHWLPCIGGRSIRPILERIDHAVRAAEARLANGEAVDSLPEPDYSCLDLLSDLATNPGGFLKVGGSSDPAEYPAVQPAGKDFLITESGERAPCRIALVAHSAAGWISRIFLSPVEYGGRTYHGASRVHSLVCLGSPMKLSKSLAFASLRYLVNCVGDKPPDNVRCLAVGASGIRSADSPGLTPGAYELCGAEPGDGTVDGDGVTPQFSSLAFPGAETLPLEGVAHAPAYPDIGPSADLARRRNEGQPWYGSPGILEQWLTWLKKP